MHNPPTDYSGISDRELLIRIDERQNQMSREVYSFKEVTDALHKDIHELEKTKLSKGSIMWLLTVLGSLLSVIASAVAFVTKVS